LVATRDGQPTTTTGSGRTPDRYRLQHERLRTTALPAPDPSACQNIPPGERETAGVLDGSRAPVEDKATWPRPDAVAAAFGLHGTVGEPDLVPGAWSNRMFRSRVGDDTFAVKELRNPWQSPAWLE